MEIAAWVRGLGLERYEPAFRENEVDLEILPELTEADLLSLGLPLGPRRKLLKAIAELRGGTASAAVAGEIPEARADFETERRQLTVMFCDLVGSTAGARAEACLRPRLGAVPAGRGHPQRFPVLFGLWQCYALGAEWQTARAVGEQLLSLAQRQHEPGYLLEAHRALAYALLWLGEFASARAHAEQGIALYDPCQHHAHAFLYGQNPGMTCRCYAALALWVLGYPDQALSRSHEALTIAQERSHPFSVAMALAYAAIIRQLRREVHPAQERAEATTTVCGEQGFPFFLALGTMPGGWALVQQGAEKEGIGHICQGLAAWRATGTEACQTYFLILLAEAWGKMGQADAGLGVLTEMLTLVDKTGERLLEAELYRLQGELLLQQTFPEMQHVEACFHPALDTSRRQQAKSQELRAAMSLALLWRDQGKRAEARDLLAPVYGWFTEGFDTSDLQEAKALLDELSANSNHESDDGVASAPARQRGVSGGVMTLEHLF
jgi:predicted ATPase